MSAPPAVEQVTVVTQPATTTAAPASTPTQTTTVVTQPAAASTTQATTSPVSKTTKPVVTASKTLDDAAIAFDYKSAHLRLDVATTEEALYHSRRNAVSWKGPLQLEAYLRREAHLANQAFTRDGGLTTWVLLSTADASERKYLAGCETYRKRAFLSQDGVVKEVTAHGIGSVFVPEEHRGKKYAERMMEELGERLRTWKAEQYPCLFSVLYSDIGKVCSVTLSSLYMTLTTTHRSSTLALAGSHFLLLTSTSVPSPHPCSGKSMAMSSLYT